MHLFLQSYQLSPEFPTPFKHCSIFRFPDVSPASLSSSGLPIPPCPMSGSLPWHLSLAVFRSRPSAEPGRSCLFSAWQLCGQQTPHLMTSWHTHSRPSAFYLCQGQRRTLIFFDPHVSDYTFSKPCKRYSWKRDRNNSSYGTYFRLKRGLLGINSIPIQLSMTSSAK